MVFSLVHDFFSYKSENFKRYTGIIHVIPTCLLTNSFPLLTISGQELTNVNKCFIVSQNYVVSRINVDVLI